MTIEIERDSCDLCTLRVTFDSGATAEVHILEAEHRESALRGEVYYPPLVTVQGADGELLEAVPIDEPDVDTVGSRLRNAARAIRASNESAS